METQINHNFFERRPITKSKTPAVKWFKECGAPRCCSNGGKVLTFQMGYSATLKAMKEKSNEPEAAEPEPEPTTEVLFLCSYEGCGKTFIDAGALRKHSHIHGERQYVCHYEGCGKKFLDSSKLKRHFLIHTGERDFVCPHEGCGKAFSLDFNLRSHMKTHSQENYHICPYPDCGKRYAHEYKLKNHIASHHEKWWLGKIMGRWQVEMCGNLEVPCDERRDWAVEEENANSNVDMTKYAQVQQPPEKVSKTSKPSASAYGSASSDRPYCCPYEGCDKAYIHEYKLNLHLRREHPGHLSDENTKNTQSAIDNDMDEGSDQDAYAGKRGNSSKMQKQSKPKPNLKLPPSKVARKGSTASPANLNLVKKAWPVKEEVYDEEEDSEETEEDRDNVEDGWRYAENNEDDDEETEYED
ncbi:unnamed protein product [Camellia sinensis]